MRYFLLIIFWTLACAVTSQAAVDVLQPGVYYTRGDYSNKQRSRDYSAYGTVGIGSRYFVSAGFSDLRITASDWKYHQQLFTAGALLTHLPYSVKAYYGRVNGRYDAKGWDYRYYDHSNFYSAELIYWHSPLTLGLEYVRGDGNGYSKQRTDQFTLRQEIQFGRKTRLSIRPNYIWVMDGPLSQPDLSGSRDNVKGPRHLASLYGKIVWQPIPALRFTGGGFLGQRAYYFDNDLLVMYNQNETQLGMHFVQAEAVVWKNLTLLGEYIHTDFDAYSIQYLVFGLKSRFVF